MSEPEEPQPEPGIVRYGAVWPENTSDIEIERACIKLGGHWTDDNGETCGEGLFYHFKHFQELLWPEKIWHRWNELELRCYLDHRIIGVMGPASSGKSFSAATNVLTDYYAFPDCTTVLVSSTELEMLELRVWGEMKKMHRLARERWPNCPGYLIESRRRIVTDDKDDKEGRDFRSGAQGVPCKRGDSWQGLGSFAGVKNRRVRLIADEAALCPPIFVEAISNLNKNPDFKCLALGNPKSTTDALGRICEPSDELGGWESNIDQTGPTKTWPTRFDDGICIQLVGSDSPNKDGTLGVDLITQKQIDSDIRFYGPDSLQFTMMNEGRMPRGEGSRRVLTRQMALQFHAMDPVVWRGNTVVKIGFLDAAYGNVGGDRCIFGELQFGMDIRGRQTMALIDTMVVPVSARNRDVTAEDQISDFCRVECIRRGIEPENFFYDAGMRTSLVMSFSRMWSPAVVSIDSMGQPTERPADTTLFIVENGRRRLKTCREHYSKFVTELWFSVRYVIEADQFRGMTEELLLEGSSREWGMVGANRIEVEPKAKMKLRMGRSPDCFVTGTMVTTSDGNKPIETIKIGDRVETPFGFSDVIATQESEVSELSEVQFSDGSVLAGKGKHKVFTWDSGWVRLDELSIANMCESVEHACLWHTLNGLFTRDGRTTFKALVDIIRMAEKMRRRDFYTELSGANIVVLFLKSIASITKMVIGQITGWLISNWSNMVNTLAYTCGKAGRILKFGSGSCADWVIGWRLPPSGTVLQRDMLGTVKIPSVNGSAKNVLRKTVSIVDDDIGRFIQKNLGTADEPVFKSTIANVTRLLKDCAAFVAKSLSPSVTTKRRIAPVTVRRLQLQESRKVYNLTLREHNVYYANGILVQNCFDALAYGVEGARQRGFQIARLVNEQATTSDERWRGDLRRREERLRKSYELAYDA